MLAQRVIASLDIERGTERNSKADKQEHVHRERIPVEPRQVPLLLDHRDYHGHDWSEPRRQVGVFLKPIHFRILYR